ncbi:interferon gamma receptor 1 [Genypterus blacodes]|uniref:interferon gamma receptor 1 n=1 Tax=Genypterus blacodes TaxID=154954 RepID=UPI003F75A089
MIEMCVSVILLLLPAVSAVLPPTDVTVSCHNLKTVVRWNYSEQQGDSSFRVNVSGSEGHFQTVTQERHYDLSHFLLQSVYHLLGFHYVQVTAIQASHESATVTSQTFAFNEAKTTHIKCTLDFPPVVLTVDGLGARVTFQNPLQWYQELKNFHRLQAFLDFTVTVVGGGGEEFNTQCLSSETCSCDVQLLERRKEQCVELSGGMVVERIHRVPFTEMSVCAQDTTDDFSTLTLALLLSFLATVVAVLIFCICKVKAWTMTSPSPPYSLAPPCSNAGTPVMDLKKDVVSRAEHVDCTSRRPSDGGEYGRGGDLEELEAEDAAGHDSSEEEASASGYDRKQRLQVDMGGGDMVMAYDGR